MSVPLKCFLIMHRDESMNKSSLFRKGIDLLFLSAADNKHSSTLLFPGCILFCVQLQRKGEKQNGSHQVKGTLRFQLLVSHPIGLDRLEKL